MTPVTNLRSRRRLGRHGQGSDPRRRPVVPRRAGRSRHRPRTLRLGARTADRQPAWPLRSGLVRCERAVLERRRSAAGARPLPLPHALQPGRAAWTSCGCRTVPARRTATRARPGAPSPRHFHLFRGTPSALWLNHVFAEVFGLDVRLGEQTADHYFDAIGAALATEAFRPRALFDRFNIEVLATTESPVDMLEHHAAIRASGWGGRVITAYRPDPVIDAEHEAFRKLAGPLRRAFRRGCDELAAATSRRIAIAGRRSSRPAPPRPTTAIRRAAHRRPIPARGRATVRNDRLRQGHAGGG